MIVFERDGILKKWIENGLQETFDSSVFIGIERGGQIAAVAAYHQFRLPDIQMSFHSSTARWASREALGAIFRYPFVQLGCKRVTAITADTNQPMRALLCRLGFKEEGLHPDLFANGGAVSYGLLAHDAKRWIEPEEYRIGKIQPVASTGPESNNGC